MGYKLLADLIVALHLLWILFMLAGFILAAGGFFKKELFDWWRFRTLHFFGIAFAGTLALLGKYCPLTIWENLLRAKYDPSLTYPGSFMIYYFERFIYPDVNPLVIRIPTTFVALFSVLVFFLRPPKKIKGFVKQFLKKKI